VVFAEVSENADLARVRELLEGVARGLNGRAGISREEVEELLVQELSTFEI